MLALMATITPAEAQRYDSFPKEEPKSRVWMELGIGLNAAYTDVKDISSDVIGVNPRLGYGGHFDMAVCFGKYFAIEAEVAYQRSNVHIYDVRNNRYTLKNHTIDIPLLLSLRVANKHLRFNAGPVFTVMSKSQYDTAGEVREYGPMYPTWNLTGGIGICIGRYFLIEARYIYALKTTYNQIEGVELTSRPHRITAGFTVIF